MLTQRRPSYRFSGHESFACRYAWLPKAYRSLTLDPAIFREETSAMVEMGLGKNMVRSLRFWVEATGMATSASQGLIPTPLAHQIFAKNGLDPFLEDRQTLWLIHWNLCSRDTEMLFAWDFLLSSWPYPELTRTEALIAFQRESERLGFEHSVVTLAQHLDVFLNTYLGSRSAKSALEDSLDGPLVELQLLQPIGERKVDGGRFEAVYAFRREQKPEISQALFDYCVTDFWTRFHPDEKTLTLHDIAMAPRSPGQVFKLPEDDVRARLESRKHSYKPPYSFQPSAVQGLLFRTDDAVSLEQIFDQELIDA